MKIAFCGDVLIAKRLPERLSDSLKKIQSILNSSDCRIGNLETTIHSKEGYPAAFPGGGYAAASPLCLKDVKRLGFNMLNTANNHAMDYSCNGLLATIKYLNNEEIPFAGTGANLSEASQPAYFECQDGRVALIGVTSSFHDSYAAGPQNQDMLGRPGVSPLRHKALYELDEKDYNDIVRIAESTGINAYHASAIRCGYLLGSKNFKFGSYEFKKGKSGIVHTTSLEEDLNRTLSNIRDAKRQSKVVVLSVHSHQFLGEDDKLEPEFIETFVHKCVDEGADVVICHGPHLLRKIEVYHGHVIFHGLGNFICQYELADYLPEDFYRKYGRTRETSDGVGDVYATRSGNGKKGMKTEDKYWKSMMVEMDVTDAEYKVKVYPVELDRMSGLPSIAENDDILHNLIAISGSIPGVRIEDNKMEFIVNR